MRNGRDEVQTEPWTGLLIAYADTRLAASEIRPEFICSGAALLWLDLFCSRIVRRSGICERFLGSRSPSDYIAGGRLPVERHCWPRVYLNVPVLQYHK